MAEKRYQVFVSSTFRDLLEERQKVAQALLGMDCIPAGMELFPAIDEEQWEFIKKVIDDCDYYILILGGRYGSTSADGISYTEKEFDYAVSKGIRVIALLHQNPDSLSLEKSEIEPEARAKLKSFREKVSQSRLVKTWTTSDELPGLVALSLLKTMKAYPAPGWIRATGQSSEELLQELNTLRKEKERLEGELRQLQAQLEIESEQLASGLDSLEVDGYFKRTYDGPKKAWSTTTTWNRILYHLGPRLYKQEGDYTVNGYLAKGIVRVDLQQDCYEAYIKDDVFYTIRAQLEALGYVKVQTLPLQRGGQGVFWQLTPRGKNRLFSLRLVEKAESSTWPTPPEQNAAEEPG